MKKLVVSDDIAKLFNSIEYVSQICDQSGRVLGTFVPYVDPSRYEVIGPDLSSEELNQIAQSTEWYTTSEVLQHLESLK